MEVISLALAILNLYCVVLRAVLTPQPHPGFFYVDSVANSVVTTECQVVNCVCVNHYYESSLRVRYSRDELLFLNKTPHGISRTTAARLSELGIERSALSDQKTKTYKRGNRGGRRKQRQICVVTGNRPECLHQPRVTFIPKNLIVIDTKNTVLDISRNLKVILFNAQST